MYDAGGPDKLVVVQVTNLNGEPLPNAVMEVQVYYEGENGNHGNASADAPGMIRCYSPGWFGPERMEIYVVSAPGYQPRRVVNVEPSEAERARYRQSLIREESRRPPVILEKQPTRPIGNEDAGPTTSRNRRDKPCLELSRKIILERVP